MCCVVLRNTAIGKCTERPARASHHATENAWSGAGSSVDSGRPTRRCTLANAPNVVRHKHVVTHVSGPRTLGQAHCPPTIGTPDIGPIGDSAGAGPGRPRGVAEVEVARSLALVQRRA